MCPSSGRNEVSLLKDFKYLWICLSLIFIAVCYQGLVFSEPKYQVGSCFMQLGIRYYVVGYESGTYTTVQYISFKGELREFRKPILVSQSAVETYSANINCPTEFRR